MGWELARDYPTRVWDAKKALAGADRGIAEAKEHQAALASAQRTFVSVAGADGQPCSIALPCRSFAAAIAQTNAGGEVIADGDEVALLPPVSGGAPG